MENFGAEKYRTKNKISPLDGPHSRTREDRRGISELEGRTIIIQSEPQRESRLKQMERASDACEVITKYLTFLSAEESQKRKKAGLKRYLKK